MTELARVLLAAVFGVAAVAKLADRDGSRRALAGFSVPRRLVGPLAVGLPLAELAIAAGLVPAASARAAAVAAAALLATFVVAIAAAIASGRKPDRLCFGQLYSAPAGPATLMRNVCSPAWRR